MVQFGVPNIPVTSTTRKILIKRLRNLIDSEKSKLRRDTDYATRYSSDEDLSSSANDKKAKGAKGRSRSTISTSASRLANRSNVSMPPPPPTIQKPSTSLWSEKSQVNKNKIFVCRFKIINCPIAYLKSTKKSPTSSIYISPLIHHETDEDSDQNDGLTTSFSSRYQNNSASIRYVPCFRIFDQLSA